MHRPLFGTLLGAACAVALSMPAIAQQPAPEQGLMTAERTSQPGTVAGASAEHVTATVMAVDLEKRHVTLKGPKGRVETVAIGPDVRNLDQVKVGDKVVVWFTRGFALQLLPPGAPAVAPTATASATRATAGEKPSGELKASVTETVTIKAIDMKSRIVTLESPKGDLYRVKAGKDVHIEKVKPGDKLVGTYTETLAIKVTPASKGAAQK